MLLLRFGLSALVATMQLSPGTAFALGGSASIPAERSILPHAIMVLGSKGSACSGTLVASDIVLTAGHCVQGSKQLAIAFLVNGNPLLEPVVEFTTHPQFSSADARSVDLALVRLPKPLGANFRPVGLEEDDSQSDSFVIAGFGLQKPHDEASAGKLRAAIVDVLPLTTSRMLHLGRERAPSELQVCKGDSGGPVFGFDKGDAVLSGVIVATYNSNVKPGARWSAICGNTAQAVRLGPHRQWILSVLTRWR